MYDISLDLYIYSSLRLGLVGGVGLSAVLLAQAEEQRLAPAPGGDFAADAPVDPHLQGDAGPRDLVI